MTPYSIPADPEFYEEALHFIDVCKTDCTCPDHWHFMWASLKAAGLRRGVYHQYAVFKNVLANRLHAGSRIFIAGAADAGSLHVLNAVAGNTRVEFTVMDRCQAPLTMVERYGRQHRVHLSTRLGDISNLTQDTCWDVILIHNTLILMDREARINALKQAARQLAPNGVILCNVRYNTPTDARDSSLQADECASIIQKLQTTFAAHPAVVELISPLILPYVKAQNESLAMRPTKDRLTDEIRQAGLEVFEEYPDTSVMPSIVSSRNSALNIQAELLLLRRAPNR